MAAQKNPFAENFQQALLDAGYPARASGEWDQQTIDNLHEFAQDHGFPQYDYPTAEILALLEIHPSFWYATAKTAGAPQAALEDISTKAKKQQALLAAEALKEGFTSRTSGGATRTSTSTTPLIGEDRVGDRTYTPTATTQPSTQEPAPRAQTATDTALTPQEKPFKMPTWGWVAVGAGGLALVGAVGYAVWKSNQAAAQPAVGRWDW